MTGYKLRMRDELEHRYGELRMQSIRLANNALRIPDTRISLVDATAYAAFQRWSNHQNRKVDWDWPNAWHSWILPALARAAPEDGTPILE